MIRITPAIVLFLSVQGLMGQSPFVRSYAVPTDPLETTSVNMRVVETVNGDLLLSSNHAHQDDLGNTIYVSFIHRVGADGTALWRKKIESVNDNLRITGIRELPDGTISVVGVMGSGNANAALLLYSAAGDPIMARRFTTVGAMGFDDVAALTDSTLLIVGNRYGPSSGPLVMIVANDGTVINASFLSYPDLGGVFHRITRCSDGGWLLVGDGAGSLSDNDVMPFNLFIAKLDSAAGLTWATRLERPITWGTGYMYMAGGNEIPGDGYRIIADQRFLVPFGHGFLVAALTAEGQLTWSKKITPSFSFQPRASMNVSDTTLAITGSRLEGNVISIIGSSGTNLGAYVTHPDMSTHDAIRTSDGMIVTASLASFGETATDAPALIKDELMPTLCAGGGVAMAQDTFGLASYQDLVPVPLDVATWDLSPDLTITDQVAVETPQCVSTAMTSADLPVVATWMVGDQLIVTGDGVDRVLVLDLSGRVIKVDALRGDDRRQIDLSSTASGIYVVLVHQGPDIRASKVFKE